MEQRIDRKRSWRMASLVMIILVVAFASIAILIYGWSPVDPAVDRGRDHEARSAREILPAVGTAAHELGPRRRIEVPEPAFLVFLAEDQNAQPLDGVQVVSVREPPTERVIALLPEAVLGTTGSSGRLAVPFARANSTRYYAYRSDLGSVEFARNGKVWRASYAKLYERSIFCRSRDGEPLSDVSIVLSEQPIAPRHLELASRSDPMLALQDDVERKVYRFRADGGGVIHLQLPAGEFIFEMFSPHWAYESGIDPYEPLVIPGDRANAVFEPIYAVVAELSRDQCVTVESSTPPGLDHYTKYNTDSLNRERKQLSKDYPGKLVRCFVASPAVDPEKMMLPTRIYWKCCGWKAHPLRLDRADQIEVQRLSSTKPAQGELRPRTAELRVILRDPRGNKIPEQKLYATFVDDSNLLPEFRAAQEFLGDHLQFLLRSGEAHEVIPGVYTLASAHSGSSIALADAQVALAPGESKDLEIAVDDVLRRCQVVSESTADAPNISVGFSDQEGRRLAHYGGQLRVHPVVMLPVGTAKLWIRVMADLVYETEVEVVYDPEYAVQTIDVPGEVFLR